MKAGAILILGLAAGLLLPGESAGAKRGSSTPKERTRAVKLVKELEMDPYGAGAREARRWLSLWLVETPDLEVDLCPELFGGTPAERKRIPSEVVAQTLYSGVAFVIENPGKAEVREQIYGAGMLGALRVYEAMVKTRPDLRSPLVDGLLAKREAGTLPEHVAGSMAGCAASRSLRPLQPPRSVKSD